MRRLLSLIPAFRAANRSGTFAGMRGESVPTIHVLPIGPPGPGCTGQPGRLRTFFAFLCLTLLGLLPPCASMAAVPPGTIIDNTATAIFNGSQTATSNLVRITTMVKRTPSTLTFLQYAPADPGAATVAIPATSFSVTGDLANPLPFQPVGTYDAQFQLPAALPVVTASTFHGGQPLILRLEDRDQNLDPAVSEQVLVRISCPGTGDSELLRLTEDGTDSGIFHGYVLTSTAAGSDRNGTLAVTIDSTLSATYVDAADSQDVSFDAALIDPYGILFDSVTGDPVNGALVTLWDVAADQPATVFDDFGQPGYPASVTTGDPGLGFPAGGFRFPQINPGREYRLIVQPPGGYRTPSQITPDALRSNFGDRFTLEDRASYAEPFLVNPGPAINIDIPADPSAGTLWLRKEVSEPVAAVGDFLRYTLTLENTDESQAAYGIVLEDRLPPGFRFREGSLHRGGSRQQDPAIGKDGRSLQIGLGDLEPGQSLSLSYVVEIAAGAGTGEAVNLAFARDRFDNRSNVASASVTLRDVFFRNRAFLAGRVLINSGTGEKHAEKGVPGVRIYLEDGTYVITDREGRYHFEGIEPGVHVVQLDLDTLPPASVPVPGTEGDRVAGRAFSRFVDLQGGTLWQVDFQLETKPPPRGEARLELSGIMTEGLFSLSVPLQVSGLGLDNLRLSLILPGLAYVPGSSRLDGMPLEDPEGQGPVLTYRLGGRPAGWSGRITLQTRATGENAGAAAKAVLTFDSPAQKNQRTPMAEILPASGKEAALVSGPQATATLGVTPGADMPTGGVPATGTEMPEYSQTELEKANPALAWLWPANDHVPPIPSIKVAIQHLPGQKIRLLLDGSDVSPLTFEGTKKNSAGTVAVSIWRGVGVHDGDNRLAAEIVDAAGARVGRLTRNVHFSYPPTQAQLLPEESVLTADGRTAPVLALQLKDRAGFPAREGLVGDFAVAPPYLPLQPDDPVGPAADSAQQVRYQVGPGGIARIRLEPTTQAGEAVVSLRLENGPQEIRAWLRPAARDWVLVGFAEGTAGYHTLSGNMVTSEEAGIEEDGYTDGRVKFFAKGAIKGEWLLTLAYDSDRPDLDGDSLRQVIDPDAYYPLYGDGTRQGYEAASARDLYVKLERGQFYALFGDMQTGLTQTELARYVRSLNGFKSELQGERFAYTVFAADTRQGFAKDEIRGDGTSGRYRLSRKKLVVNSEEVVVETRDRFHNERILRAEPLSRHLDYDIDYDAGTLYFKRPVPSKDDDFNPVFIVVRYETEASGSPNLTYGGRAAAKFLERTVEVGASLVHEDNGENEGDLLGADVSVRLTPQTSLRAEVVTTEVEEFDATQEGEAWLAEMIHRSERIDARAWLREQEAGFGLGQQNGGTDGMRTYGAEGTYRLSPRWNLAGEAYREDNLVTDARRDVATLEGRFRADHHSLHLGWREARDRFDGGGTEHSRQILGGGEWSPDRRLKLRLSHEQALGNRNENADYPTRTLLGADYRLSSAVSLFAAQEFTWGDEEDTEGTRLGLKAAPWQGGELRSGIERQLGENGERLLALFGVGQKWQMNERWLLDLSLDRSSTVKHPGNGERVNEKVPAASGADEDFTAVSLGTTYRAPSWSWWNRVETRHAESEDKVGVHSGLVRELREGTAVSARLQAFVADGAAARSDEEEVRFGLAYRPAGSRWMLLGRLDLALENRTENGSDTEDWRIVNHLHGNWRPGGHWQTSFYHGLKYVRATFDGDRYEGTTDLAAAETRYHFTPRWDLGAHAALLHSWNSRQFDYSAGASIGFLAMTNAWISLGYNVTGFEDDDFEPAGYTARGPFLRLRMKFDQQSVTEALRWFDGGLPGG